MFTEVRAVPKKQKHNRRVPKQKDLTKITPEVIEAVALRCEGVCEKCGRRPAFGTIRERLELAHLEQRSHLGRGDQPWNIAALCGPHTTPGTCHWEIDSRRRQSRNWVNQKIAELKTLYREEEWPG